MDIYNEYELERMWEEKCRHDEEQYEQYMNEIMQCESVCFEDEVSTGAFNMLVTLLCKMGMYEFKHNNEPLYTFAPYMAEYGGKHEIIREIKRNQERRS